MKTAAVTRLPIWGTPYHSVNLMYRGKNIWQEIDRFDYIDEHGLNKPLLELARVARIHKFTHWRFSGDWTKRTKPRGGLINRGE